MKNLSMTIGVFFVVFVLGLVSAQNDLEPSPQSDMESMEEIRELLKNVQLIFERKKASMVREGTVPEDEEEDGENDVAVAPNGCYCLGLRCFCCKLFSSAKLNLNGNTCVEMTYVPRSYDIMFTLTFRSRTVISNAVRAKNPTILCGRIPYPSPGNSLCIQFYSFNFGQTSVCGCAMLLGKHLNVTIEKINVGCFCFTSDVIQQVGEVEVPYLEESPALVEGPEPIYIREVPMEKIKVAGYKKN